MRTWQVLVLMAGFLVAGGALRADGTPPPKPWQVPGTKVGDEIVGPDGGKMVWVPAGEFMMGEADFVDATPIHKVRITKGFWLGKCTVTTAQWQRCIQEGGAPDWPANQGSKPTVPGSDYPAVFTSWDSATAYCKHYGLSLPTEAQWEYAAAGPEGRQYPWGNTWDPTKCCNVNNRSSTGFTWPVGSFPQGASWCGALDMVGNVYQWCQDWYAQKYYAQAPEDDPAGPNEGRWRVVRGGSWNDEPCGYFRCAHRLIFVTPSYWLGCNGFRCAYTP
jgi:formylglycine-generating enzyme required for sulfatase activity